MSRPTLSLVRQTSNNAASRVVDDDDTGAASPGLVFVGGAAAGFAGGASKAPARVAAPPTGLGIHARPRMMPGPGLGFPASSTAGTPSLMLPPGSTSSPRGIAAVKPRVVAGGKPSLLAGGGDDMSLDVGTLGGSSMGDNLGDSSEWSNNYGTGGLIAVARAQAAAQAAQEVAAAGVAGATGAASKYSAMNVQLGLFRGQRVDGPGAAAPALALPGDAAAARPQMGLGGGAREVRTGSGLASPRAGDEDRPRLFMPATGGRAGDGLRDKRAAAGIPVLPSAAPTLDVGRGMRSGARRNSQAEEPGVAGEWYDPDDDDDAGGRGMLDLELEIEDDAGGELDDGPELDVGGGGGAMEGTWGISDTGTLKLGAFIAINERGIKEFRVSSQRLDATAGSPTAPRGVPMSVQRTGNIKSELVMLGMLGKGASSYVQRALHLPSLQLVAVKHLRMHDADKRTLMASELKALYANMVPLVHRPTAAFGDTMGMEGTMGSTMGGTLGTLTNAALFMAQTGVMMGGTAGSGGGGGLPRPPRHPPVALAVVSGSPSRLLSTKTAAIPEDTVVDDDPGVLMASGSSGGRRFSTRGSVMMSALPVSTHALEVEPAPGVSPPGVGAARDGGLSYSTEQLAGATLSGDHLADSMSGSASEIEAAANPYIVKFYDAFVNASAGTVSIVMEYMGGGSLQKIVDTGGCHDERVLARIAAHMFRGLHFLHRNRQLHRDIKPDNILVSTLGDQFKLADFGIATQLEGTVELAQTWVGTMAYMSPERLISGQGYGFPADVWAAGLSLLAVAAGAFPYPETSYWELIKYIKDDPAPLHIITGAKPSVSGTPAAGKIAPKVDCKPWVTPPSPELCDFIAQCLRKDPAARPTAEQLLSHPFILAHIDDANPGAAAKRPAAARQNPAMHVLDSDGAALSGIGKDVLPEGLYADVGVALTERTAASKSQFPAAFSSRPPAEQDSVIQSLNEIVACVVDTHWGGFLRYFRRYRHKRRKKWYYSLDETSFNAFLAERLAATGTMNATMARQMMGAAMDNPAMQAQLQAFGRSSGIGIARVVSSSHVPTNDAGAAARKPPVSLTTTQAHAALAATVVTAKEVLLDLYDVRTLAAQLALPPLLVRTGFNDAITKRCDAVAAAKAASAASSATAARNVPSHTSSSIATSTVSRSSSLRQKQADGVAQLQAQAAASREYSSLLAQAAALERSGGGSGMPRTVLDDDDDDDDASGHGSAKPSLVVSALPPTHASGRARGSDHGHKHSHTGSGSSTGGAATASPAESATSSSSGASGRKTIHVSVPSALTATPVRRTTPPTSSAVAYTGTSTVSSSSASSAALARGGNGFAFSPPQDTSLPPFSTQSRHSSTDEYAGHSSSRDSRPGSGATSRLSRAGASVIGPSSTPTPMPPRTPTSGSKVERAVARLGNVEYAVDIPELPSAGGASGHSRVGAGSSGAASAYTPKSGTSTPAGSSYASPSSEGARGGSTVSSAGRSIAATGSITTAAARYHLGGAR